MHLEYKDLLNRLAICKEKLLEPSPVAFLKATNNSSSKEFELSDKQSYVELLQHLLFLPETYKEYPVIFQDKENDSYYLLKDVVLSKFDREITFENCLVLVIINCNIAIKSYMPVLEINE